MELARTVDADQLVADDFSDLIFPPYGENLYYKIVAVRKIKNELSQDEDILSFPSKPIQTQVADVLNPPAPRLFAENGTAAPLVLQNVVLKWNPTAYNGIYSLQKMNNNGNWVEFYRIKVRHTAMQYPPTDKKGTPDFANFPETKSLPRTDADGNKIYHRYRVQVENASGLFNLSEFELTLAKGVSDFQQTDSLLRFADANNHTLPILISGTIGTGINYPGQMTFTHRNTPLPAGHNIFIRIEISVTDDLGHMFTQTIMAPGGSVTFGQGDGGLVLDASAPGRVYTIRTKTFTDFASAGALQVFTLSYQAAL
jgi:hypothetical protein